MTMITKYRSYERKCWVSVNVSCTDCQRVLLHHTGTSYFGRKYRIENECSDLSTTFSIKYSIIYLFNNSFNPVYQILSIRSLHIPTPHRADGWPLTKPLQCVSLRVERRGDVLLLIFTYTHGSGQKQKLFALCPIDLINQVDQEKKKMDHYVEAVLDSTRYFVVRVKDDKANREALIGLGFRDREEAGDFRAALSKYEQDISKERANR